MIRRHAPRALSWLGFAFLWAGCTSGGDGGGGGGESVPDAAADDAAVRILAPADGETLRGLAPLVFEFDTPDGFSRLAVERDGETILTSPHPGTAIEVDTRAASDGPHTLTVVVTDAAGTERRSSVEVLFDNPSFQLDMVLVDEAEHADGDVVTIHAHYGMPGLLVTADLSAIDSAFDPAGIDVTAENDGWYTVRYGISASNARDDGDYEVVLTATDPAAPTDTVTDPVTITLQNLPTVPYDVPNGIYVAGLPPAPTEADDDRPTVTSIDGSGVIITGGSTLYNVTWQAGASPVTHLIVWVDGYAGYFLVPVGDDASGKPTPRAGAGTATVTLSLPVEEEDYDAPPASGVSVAASSASGSVSTSASSPLSPRAVSTGEVQVSLAWDNAADLDLYVVEPTGAQIWFSGPTSPSGGTLDLDSNSNCTGRQNQENISWAAGTAPAGEYKVRVTEFDSCGDILPAFATVTARYCGKTKMWADRVDWGEDRGHNAGREIFVFDADCSNQVRGRVQYERKIPGGPVRRQPAKNVVVEVTKPNGVVITRGRTDRTGRYRIKFPAPTDNGGMYLVVVRAEIADFSTDPPTPLLHVEQSGSLVLVQSMIYDADDAEDQVVDFSITRAQKSAAWYMVERLEFYRAWLLKNLGKKMPPLHIDWDPTASTSSYSHPSEITIDDDQWNDSVQAHEVGHAILEHFSRDDSPAGAHSTYNVPTFARSEGWATFIGQKMLGHPRYTIWGTGGMTYFNIETSKDSWGILHTQAFGTQPAALAAPSPLDKISEDLVAGVLWDVADDDTDDAMKSHARALVQVIFTHLKPGSTYDNGATGVDLVDFVDLWKCEGLGGLADLYKVVIDERRFPYDKTATLSCP